MQVRWYQTTLKDIVFIGAVYSSIYRFSNVFLGNHMEAYNNYHNSCVHYYDLILVSECLLRVWCLQLFNVLVKVLSGPTEFSQQLKMNTLWFLAAWTLLHFTLSAGFSSSILSRASVFGCPNTELEV